VFWSFAIIAFYGIGLGYWVVGFWIIIAFYSIVPDIKHCFFETSSLFTA
jgi:hypothetical protein